MLHMAHDSMSVTHALRKMTIFHNIFYTNYSIFIHFYVNDRVANICHEMKSGIFVRIQEKN